MMKQALIVQLRFRPYSFGHACCVEMVGTVEQTLREFFLPHDGPSIHQVDMSGIEVLKIDSSPCRNYILHRVKFQDGSTLDLYEFDNMLSTELDPVFAGE